MNRMRGKMRFWSKTKHGEKKLSREKQASTTEAGEKHGRKKYFFYGDLIIYLLVILKMSMSTTLLLQRAVRLLTVQIWRQLLPGSSRTVRRTRRRPQR